MIFLNKNVRWSLSIFPLAAALLVLLVLLLRRRRVALLLRRRRVALPLCRLRLRVSLRCARGRPLRLRLRLQLRLRVRVRVYVLIRRHPGEAARRRHLRLAQQPARLVAREYEGRVRRRLREAREARRAAEVALQEADERDDAAAARAVGGQVLPGQVARAHEARADVDLRPVRREARLRPHVIEHDAALLRVEA